MKKRFRLRIDSVGQSQFQWKITHLILRPQILEYPSQHLNQKGLFLVKIWVFQLAIIAYDL